MPRITKRPARKTVESEVSFAPQSLPYRIRILAQTLTRHFQTALDPYNLTTLHWAVLCCLWREDGQATQAVTRDLGQLGGTLTVVLDTMQKHGLIERKADPRDGRVLRIWLTRRGKQLQTQVVPDVEKVLVDVFSGFSAAETKRLSRMVEALQLHVEGLIGAE